MATESLKSQDLKLVGLELGARPITRNTRPFKRNTWAMPTLAQRRKGMGDWPVAEEIRMVGDPPEGAPE